MNQCLAFTLGRVVNICDNQNLSVAAMFPMMIKAFPGYYDNLLNFNPVQCLETKTTFHPIRKPDSIILDVCVLSFSRVYGVR